jgi:hypothetical protein
LFWRPGWSRFAGRSLIGRGAKDNFRFNFFFTAGGRCAIHFSELEPLRESKHETVENKIQTIMTKKNKPVFGPIVAALAFAAFAACVAWADTQGDKANVISGNNSCAGAYKALAKMTNSSGNPWVTPPTNTSSGTFKDASGFAPPYTSVVLVTRKSDSTTWCGTNSVTFPATNTTSYSMAVYVTSTPPPPTNGQPLTLQVTWH